jgi:hypothetical protein
MLRSGHISVPGSCSLIAWMATGAKQRENMARKGFWEE